MTSDRKNIQSVYINGLVEAIRIAEKGQFYVTEDSWKLAPQTFDWKKSDKTPLDLVMELVFDSGLLVKGKDNYWEFITVNKSEHTTCNITGLQKLFELFSPVLTFTHVHSSVEFTNVNYFTSNYLQYHIYKVDFK